MPSCRVPITKRDVIIVLRDGSTNEAEVFMESGSLSWDEGTPEAVYFLDRDSISDGETRDGPDSAMAVKLDLALTDLASAAYTTLYGWLARPSGSWEATNLVSSLGAGRDFRIHLDVTFLGDKRGGVEDVTLRFNHFRPKLSVSEGEFLVASVSGTCKATQPERV